MSQPPGKKKRKKALNSQINATIELRRADACPDVSLVALYLFFSAVLDLLSYAIKHLTSVSSPLVVFHQKCLSIISKLYFGRKFDNIIFCNNFFCLGLMNFQIARATVSQKVA